MMWLTALLYVVAIIYVLFYDSETARSRGRSSPTWIDTVMSWIMWIVGHRLIINTIQLIFSTIAAIQGYFFAYSTISNIAPGESPQGFFSQYYDGQPPPPLPDRLSDVLEGPLIGTGIGELFT